MGCDALYYPMHPMVLRFSFAWYARLCMTERKLVMSRHTWLLKWKRQWHLYARRNLPHSYVIINSAVRSIASPKRGTFLSSDVVPDENRNTLWLTRRLRLRQLDCCKTLEYRSVNMRCYTCYSPLKTCQMLPLPRLRAVPTGTASFML